MVNRVLMSGALLLMAACADATSAASGNDASDGTVQVIYTRIYVSDHPAALCPAPHEDTDPESSIRYYFSFTPMGKNAGESIELITPRSASLWTPARIEQRFP